jgi:hypothetical protein
MHAMLEIKLSGTGALCLIPLVPQIVKSVNLAERRVLLEPPPGLLDLSYEEKQKRVIIRGYLPECVKMEDHKRIELERSTVIVTVTVL